MIRHACRTLFKQADPLALSLFGYEPADDINCDIQLANASITWSGELVFDLLIFNQQQDTLQKEGCEGRNKFMINGIKKADAKFELLAPVA